MKTNLFKEIVSETLDTMSRARLFFIVGLITSVAIEMKGGKAIGWWSMFVFCYFSTTIGIQRYMIEAHKRVSSASMEINEISYNKLMSDTDALNSMRKQLEANEANLVKQRLDSLISENTQTINAIKTAKNGVRQ